jgi:hypothetical protein
VENHQHGCGEFRRKAGDEGLERVDAARGRSDYDQIALRAHTQRAY